MKYLNGIFSFYLYWSKYLVFVWLNNETVELKRIGLLQKRQIFCFALSTRGMWIRAPTLSKSNPSFRCEKYEKWDEKRGKWETQTLVKWMRNVWSYYLEYSDVYWYIFQYSLWNLSDKYLFFALINQSETPCLYSNLVTICE